MSIGTTATPYLKFLLHFKFQVAVSPDIYLPYTLYQSILDHMFNSPLAGNALFPLQPLFIMIVPHPQPQYLWTNYVPHRTAPQDSAAHFFQNNLFDEDQNLIQEAAASSTPIPLEGSLVRRNHFPIISPFLKFVIADDAQRTKIQDPERNVTSNIGSRLTLHLSSKKKCR